MKFFSVMPASVYVSIIRSVKKETINVALKVRQYTEYSKTGCGRLKEINRSVLNNGGK